MGDPSTASTRMFFQKSSCAVDNQGRIVFPKAWKLPTDDENTSFMLTPGLGRSIHVYSEEQFQKLLQKLYTAPDTEEAQNWITIYGRHCQRITLDKQGRFALDEPLLKYAGITKKAECVGAVFYGRIFDPERWNDIQLHNKPEKTLTPEEEQKLTPEERTNLYIQKAIDYIGTLQL